MSVSRLHHCLLFVIFVCNFENGMSDSGCFDTHKKELLSRLSAKLEYIATGLQETYTLLQNMSTSGLKRDCLALLNAGISQSGVYNISVTGTNRTRVWCDMETDGGGWTVFQRRIDGATDFYRGWDEYRDGFGDANHEYWLGNENIHALTSADDTEMRVDLEDFETNTAYAKYQRFAIGNATEGYRLNISSYSGDAGDALDYHNGYQFSTKDENVFGCAVRYQGAWWYKNCYTSSLNGLYLTGQINSQGIVWQHWKTNYSLKSTKMMIRRVTK